MGYQATIILVYGVRLDPVQSVKLWEAVQDIYDPDIYFWDVVPEARLFKHRPVEGCSSDRILNIPTTPYAGHALAGIDGNVVFDCRLYSEGTDSRCDSTTYDEDHEHVFGIYVASRGYAVNDHLEDFLTVPPPEAVSNFNDFVKPILLRAGLPADPAIQVINQVH